MEYSEWLAYINTGEYQEVENGLIQHPEFALHNHGQALCWTASRGMIYAFNMIAPYCNNVELLNRSFLFSLHSQQWRQLYDSFFSGIDINFQEAFRWACDIGNTEAVQFFLTNPTVDPKENESDALQTASRQGNLELVQCLLPCSDPQAKESLALRYASRYGHTKIVALLLPHSDPRACFSESLCVACRGQHLDVVDLLLPVSCLSDNHHEALKIAMEINHPVLLEKIFLAYPVQQQRKIISGYLVSLGESALFLQSLYEKNHLAKTISSSKNSGARTRL